MALVRYCSSMAGKEDLAAAGESTADWAERLLRRAKIIVERAVGELEEPEAKPGNLTDRNARMRMVVSVVRAIELIRALSVKLERDREGRHGRPKAGDGAGHGNEDGMDSQRQDHWDDLDTASLEAELRSRLERIERMREAKQRDAGGASGAVAGHGAENTRAA